MLAGSWFRLARTTLRAVFTDDIVPITSQMRFSIPIGFVLAGRCPAESGSTSKKWGRVPGAAGGLLLHLDVLL